MSTIFNSFTIFNNTPRNIDVRLVVNGKRLPDITGVLPGTSNTIDPKVSSAQTATLFVLHQDNGRYYEGEWQQVFVGGGIIPAYVLSLTVQYNGGTSFEGKAVSEFV